MSATIRKALIPSFGDESHISIVDAKIEPPAANEVQIKVLYAGFGGGDILMRRGFYPMQKKAPLTPGYCAVGRVNENGSNCSKFNKGDLVAVLTVYDSQAELLNQPEKYIVAVPDGLDLQKATAMVLDWNTAYGMVHRSANVSKGQRVFIHGLSGAVGYASLILCKLFGAEIYGTASASKHADLRKLGVSPFVYTDKNWIPAMNAIGGAHVVFDPLGFESWDDSWSILAREGGHLIGYGGNYNVLKGGEPRSQIPGMAKLLSRNLVPFCPQKTSFYYISRDQSTYKPELEALFGMGVRGDIDPPIKALWALEQVPQAHREAKQSKGLGSVVIKVADDVGV